MVYQASFKVNQEGDPSTIIIVDDSTNPGGEVITSRKVEVTKTDLVVVTYNFTVGESTLSIAGFDKDYALDIKFIATPAVVNVNSVYNVTHQFAMLGYSQQGWTERQIQLEVDEDILDVRSFIQQSNEIKYYMDVADNRILFSDLVGSQQALDYVSDLIGASSKNMKTC